MLVAKYEKPAVGISVSSSELFPTLASPLEPKNFYPSPPSKKRKSVNSEDEEIRVSAAPRKVGVKLIGMGRKIGDGELRADISVEFILDG